MSELFRPISLVVLLGLLSCSSQRDLLDSSQIRVSTCPDLVTLLEPEKIPEDKIIQDTLLSAKYSYQDLQVANAYGFYRQLKTFEILRHVYRESGHLDSTFADYATAYNRINEGTNLAVLEVSSLIDLIDCKKHNANRFRDAVREANSISQNKLSNWAVGIGAGTTILTAGVLLSQNEQLIGGTALDWAAVAGGVIAVYLTIKSAKLDKRVYYEPDKDLIKAIWTGENINNVFPSSTWYLFNLDYDLDNTTASLRERIIDEWKRQEPRLTEESNEFVDMIMKPNREYNLELIDLRLDMLDGISLGVNQVNRALYLLNSKRY